MIKKYLHTRALRKRADELTETLDALEAQALNRREGSFDKDYRTHYDFFKANEEAEYDAAAIEHWKIAKELGIESPHFSPRRHGGWEDGNGPSSPRGMTTVKYDQHDTVTFKEEDGFFVAYRNGTPDPDVEPVAVEEWGNVVIDIDEEAVKKNTAVRERRKVFNKKYGFPRKYKREPKYPL